MGRPRKDTEDTIAKLCDALRLGATYELACKYAGISAETLRQWKIQAEQHAPGTAGHQLLERMEAAEGQAALRWLGQIEQAAMQGNWAAAAWKLERRYPDQYGRYVVQHEGKVSVTHQPEWIALRSAILVALAPYPEVRAQLAEVLSDGHSNGTGQ